MDLSELSVELWFVASPVPGVGWRIPRADAQEQAFAHDGPFTGFSLQAQGMEDVKADSSLLSKSSLLRHVPVDTRPISARHSAVLFRQRCGRPHVETRFSPLSAS